MNAADTRPLPLSDVRVVCVEQYGAGPFGSLQLADLGAEVIKIEDPRSGGDVSRTVPPFQRGDDSLFFETFNRNKLSIELDLSKPAGRTVFEDLVRCSDVVYSNLRGDVPSRLGLTYSQLSHVNRQIVCCSLSGFGMTGPRRSEPAYDYILQGVAGWMDLTGEPCGPPTKSGLSLVDFSGGLVAAASVLAGIHAARRDGVGLDCDLSLFDTAMAMLTYVATWHLTAGYEPTRRRHSAHPSLVPFQNFQTTDGWIVVACPKEKFWRRLCDAIDLPQLAEDPRFDSFTARGQNEAELLEVLAGQLATRSSAYWLGVLRAAGVPSEAVNTVPLALEEPQVAARELVVTTHHPEFGEVRQIASPMRVGSSRIVHQRGPQRGEHTQHVLRELLGYDDGRTQQLATDGAFG